MEIVGLFAGETKSPQFYEEYFHENNLETLECPRQWPEKEYPSAYLKESVDKIKVSKENGIENNGVGFPTHIANAAFRSALVVHTGVYEDYENALPGSSKNMQPGCFGENILVSHPALHPREVCIGDVYRVVGSSVVFRVTGPRMPCPKVDAFVGVQGLTALGRKKAWTGYFFQVIEDGECRVGDVLELTERPYPTYTMTRIQQSLWGDSAEQDHSEEFLSQLEQIECLIPRHYRETAVQRLERLRNN